MDIKNNTLSKKNDESSSNIYFILFIVFLVLFILFLVGFIYYWHKDKIILKILVKNYMMLFIQIQNFKSCIIYKWAK